MAAVLPLPIGEVKPMTLAMYAALERIKSPLITGEDAKDALELLPSLYLLTHGAQEIFKANLLDLALAVGFSPGRRAERDPRRLRNPAAGRQRRHSGARPKKSQDERGHDGWIAALVDYFARTYHWSFREIFWETPLSVLSLLRRQEALKESSIFPLSEIEKIDDGNA